jgi:hypothetical protein
LAFPTICFEGTPETRFFFLFQLHLLLALTELHRLTLFESHSKILKFQDLTFHSGAPEEVSNHNSIAASRRLLANAVAQAK